LRQFFSIVLFLIFSLSGAQTLKPTTASAFEPLLDFDTATIRTNKIRSITFDIIDKRDFQVAEDKNLMNYYEFNQDGQLVRFYYTTIAKTIQKEYHSQPIYKRGRRIGGGGVYYKNEYVYDTVSTIYKYHNRNLIMKRFNEGQYYETRYYNYDAKNRITKERRFKETNVSADKNNFILGNQTLISEDSFQYVDITPKQYKQICLNSEHRPYKEIIINLDEKGKIRSKDEHYTVAWIVQNTEFNYDGDRLTSATFKGNVNGDLLLKTTYECDSLNCIYTEKQFKNDVQLKEISYVTDPKTKLLNSFISRDVIFKTMRIIKLYYNYYP
jgi:hypothetical protein